MLAKKKRKNGLRQISIMLVCALGFVSAFGGLSNHVAAQEAKKKVKSVSFRDIDDSYAKDAIINLQRTGIVAGEGEGKFYPQRVITRAEASKIIVLALGLEQDLISAHAFKDVPKDSWYAGFVGALVKAGIIQGTSANTFSPQDQVTREQLAVLFIRALSLHTQSVEEKDYKAVSDWNSVSDWAKSSIQIALHIGFIKGIDNANGTIRFEPKAAAERQAIALLTNEMMTNKSTYVERAKGSAEKSKPTTNEKGTTTTPTTNSNGTNNGGVSGSGGGSESGGSGGGGSNGGSSGNNGESPKTASLTPVVSEEIYNVAGTQVTGSAEQNATVSIRHKGKVIAEQKSNAIGEFAIDIPNVHMFSISEGDTIEIMAQAEGKEVSSPLQKTVKQGRKPTAAKIYGYIDEDSGIIGTSSGSATLQDIIVTKQDGSFIECKESRGIVEGGYALALESSLVPHEKLKVYAMFKGLSASDPTEIEVEPVDGKTEFTVVTAAVYDGLSYVDVKAPKYTQFTFTNSKHQTLEIDVVRYYDNDGNLRFYFDGSQLQHGDNVYLFVNGYKKEKSGAYPITVQAAEKVTTPTVTGIVYSDGGMISGKSEPNAIVQLYAENGELIRTVNADYRGNFKALFSSPDQLLLRERLMITAKKVAKKESLPAFINVLPISGKTEQPSVPNEINGADYFISGQAEPDSVIRIKNIDGTLLWEFYALETGRINGGVPTKGLQEILVTADAFGKEESEPIKVKILESKKIETPIITSDVYNVNPIFKGTTVPGVDIVVQSLNGYGEYSNFSTDGTFHIQFNDIYQPGDEFKIYAITRGQWQSESVIVKLLPSSVAKTKTPTVVTAAVYKNGGLLTAQSDPNITIFLKDKFRRVIDSRISDFDGKVNFFLPRDIYQYNKEIFVSSLQKGLYESESVLVPILPINDVTPKPTVVDTVYSYKGTFSVDTIPFAMVVSMDDKGNTLDKRGADAQGRANMFIPPYVLDHISRLTIIAEGYGFEQSEPITVEVIPGRG